MSLGRVGKGALGLALFAVMGCTPEPDPVPSYRDPARPIASKALFEPARFAGGWHIVGRIGSDPGCAPAQVQYDISDDAVTEMLSCPNARFAPRVGTVLALGRMAFADGPRWVLWADEGYRTAVIGAPDGRFAWILDRNSQIPADRLRAAREILDFNGYDIGQIVENQ